MIDGLVFLTQLALLALVLLMAFRMLTLVRSAPLPGADAGQVELRVFAPRETTAKTTSNPVPDRTELVTQLHILAGLQDRDCRSRGLDLGDAPLAVREFATAWLFGAACALSEYPVRHSDSLADIVAHIASLKTGIRHSQAREAIATLTRNGMLLVCYREGLLGAEFWRQHHYVAPKHGLYEAVTENSFI